MNMIIARDGASNDVKVTKPYLESSSLPALRKQAVEGNLVVSVFTSGLARLQTANWIKHNTVGQAL